MDIKIYIYIVIIISSFSRMSGQEVSDVLVSTKDTVPITDQIPFLQSQSDSFQLEQDTLPLPYLVSKDAIQDEVVYNAQDTQWVDHVLNKVHLYGNAEVLYQKIKLTADYIIIHFDENVIEGFWQKKPNYKFGDTKPTFSEGAKTFTFNAIKYNFKTKKGIVTHAVTQEDEFYLLGETSKFLAGSIDTTGTVIEDDRFYNKDVVVTTCNHDPPHFGIRTDKLKFVPDKLAVMSVAQLELAGVPTPIFLPFGFFPLAKGRSSGLIFPSFDYQNDKGFFFQNLGYYYPINEHLDANVKIDFSTRGYYNLKLNTVYKKIYAYDGSVNLEYGNNVIDNNITGRQTFTKSYSISVRHNQSEKAHPYRKLGGSINILGNNHNKAVYSDYNSQTINTYTSNFTFSHSMPGTPFNFIMGLTHRQNTMDRSMEIILPDASLNMNTIYPFKRKNDPKQRWSDKIAFSYNSKLKNYVRTTDTTLFTKSTLDNFQLGMQQHASVNTNIRMLKYFNLSPNVSYDESWLLKQYMLTFDPTAEIRDSVTNELIGYERPKESFINKFSTFRSFRVNASLNTQVFGTVKFSKGYFKGIRHIIKPSISFNYAPDTKSKYERIVITDTREAYNNPITYSIFKNGPFGSLSGSEKQLGIGFNVSNVIEIKYKSKSDTVAHKLRLLDNFNFSGNYNFQADSLKWAPITMNGNTRILKGLTTVQFSGMISPYKYNSADKITNTTLWSDSKKILQVRNINVIFSTNFTIQRLIDVFKNKEEDKKTQSNTKDDTKKEEKMALADWVQSISITHSLNVSYLARSRGDTTFVSNHTLGINGSINLSKSWSIGIGHIGYDFKSNKITYPSLTFNRDLHCWKSWISWAPVNGYYSFFIGVNSSALEFLKYNYNTGFSNFR